MQINTDKVSLDMSGGRIIGIFDYCKLLIVAKVIIPFMAKVLADEMVRTLKEITKDIEDWEASSCNSTPIK